MIGLGTSSRNTTPAPKAKAKLDDIYKTLQPIANQDKQAL